MGRRRKQNGIEVFAALPWPVGVAAGLIGFIGVRYGFDWWMARQGGPLAQGFYQGSGTMLSPLAWMVLAICWIGALASFLGSRHRRKLLDTRTDLESLSQGGWRQFELLVGEAFRRQGYAVEETGLGGADGGIDLILRKDGRRTLVQCKQWKRQQIGVSVVREMAGLLAHHHAHAVKIVCIGSYTKDAERFAQGKPIELVSGIRLLEMIRVVQRQAGAAPVSVTPRVNPAMVAFEAPTAAARVEASVCQRCGSDLVQRTNRQTGENFLGCSQFPKCRGTG
ncbi:restriction endonuclease [Pseudoxanthomonas winnipegensis]|uniref:Restriction endonuclease n=1 Tax=Pseudoxanthomonas winnipegensis TaxID=2480810 RepID=A0A4Q8LC59_9GAMM|nr:restriction endonuclease [Pseudoxanthomonas winnipegensis]RZZ83792.1 restriction endonuclease [Pseudoxanthomonas winnipegensis]TAA26457.1 restriction endonuclease [Pseudoxanthomonas winnipegensis]TAA42942.1 restriction endonuclease [Pseudoxanthomonas winnipegensis]TBV73834.1 restriction endonuclease [Pseudoxanthomonas winnipegensis]